MKTYISIPVIGIVMISMWAVADAVEPENICGKGSEVRSAPIPMERIFYAVDSGIHSGTTTSREPVQAFQANVGVQDARWLRLHFEDFHLGRRSYITITSSVDGEQQRFDARSLEQWHGSSAYFDGNAVEIALFVASRDEDVFFRLSEVSIGKKKIEENKEGSSETLLSCHGPDDRVSSNDNAIGRIMPAGCTGFVASNGVYMSAGHCDHENNFDIIQFNVPDSDTDGTPNSPSVHDQYPIASIIDYRNNGQGDDWVVFSVHPNSNTGLLPTQTYGDYYRLMQGITLVDSIRVTGYGLDNGLKNQTQQTAMGRNNFYSGSGDVIVYHNAFVEFGNSGSPIIDEKSKNVSLTIAIDAFSISGSLCNGGTTFNNNDLASAIETFPGPNTLYVDNGHPFAGSGGGGSIFEPYETLQQAANQDPAGGIVSMAAGIYPGAVTIDKAMTIQAPVGTVTIGGSGMLKMVDQQYYKSKQNKPARFRLFANYPNPFNPVTTISYDLPEHADVRLEIFDILGRRAARLVNETQPPGTHQVSWDATAVASGVYIYRITVGDVTQSRQMMLVK